MLVVLFVTVEVIFVRRLSLFEIVMVIVGLLLILVLPLVLVPLVVV